MIKHNIPLQSEIENPKIFNLISIRKKSNVQKLLINNYPSSDYRS